MLTDKMIYALVPLVLIQIILIVVCIRDWKDRVHFKMLNKWAWLVLILFVNLIGPILYLTMGKDNERD